MTFHVVYDLSACKMLQTIEMGESKRNCNEKKNRDEMNVMKLNQKWIKFQLD